MERRNNLSVFEDGIARKNIFISQEKSFSCWEWRSAVDRFLLEEDEEISAQGQDDK
jgi:hypothetical protein